VRVLPIDDDFRMRVDALSSAIASDRAAGLVPFLVASSAGTTNTGAVDPLGAISDVCAREGLWHHVDGAYGAFFHAVPELRPLLDGLPRADSLTLDPHKGLFLPYGTGALLVRDGEALKRAHALSADYMPSMQEDPDLVDFNLLSPELSRDFRGLRLWLPLKMHGAGPFRRQLDEKLDLARWAADALRHVPGIELVAEPQLSTLAFRLVRPGLDEARLTRLNRAVLDRINARQRVLLSPTMLGDRFVIRICIVSFRTHADRVAEAVAIVRDAVRESAP